MKKLMTVADIFVSYKFKTNENCTMFLLRVGFHDERVEGATSSLNIRGKGLKEVNHKIYRPIIPAATIRLFIRFSSLKREKKYFKFVKGLAVLI